jgi:REP element-mobilizing transposase RayT
MLRGFHIIFSAYGFWLPNDPRRSWSDWVRRWELLRFGKATKVTTRQSAASVEHDHDLRMSAKLALMYPAVRFTGPQARAIGIGFRTAVEESDYLIYACSILPEHVHLVFGPHQRTVQRIVGHLKARGTQQLSRDGLHPLRNFREKDGTIPSPWGRNCWKVFLYDEQHLRNAIAYVEGNPQQEGKPRQRWSCVRRYGGDAGGKLPRDM